jgi:hypothetical protein
MGTRQRRFPLRSATREGRGAIKAGRGIHFLELEVFGLNGVYEYTP